MHVSFDENFKDFVEINHEDDFVTLNNESNETNCETVHPNKKIKLLKDQPIQNILGNIESFVKTKNQLNKVSSVAFISTIEP